MRGQRLHRTTTEPIWTGSSSKCCAPSALPHGSSRRPSRPVFRDAAIRPSPTTPAAIGTARSARPTRATSGSRTRSQELLPVPYFHVVFTLPHELSALACRTRSVLYDLLFRASAETLLEVAADPKHLGAEIGFLSVLHTWGQNLLHHPHVHCVIPAGGLSPDQLALDPRATPFFLPVGAQQRVSRQVRRRPEDASSADRSCASMASSNALAEPKRFAKFLRSYSGKTGSSMPSRPSADRSTCCTIWRATRTASPSPTIA